MLTKLEDLTEENCLDALRNEVALRNKMGGALYWNIVNDDCQQIADKCIFKFKKDCDLITEILNR